MRLHRRPWPDRGFADALNDLLWGALLPGFIDDDPAELFFGIGSSLDCRHPPAARKIVAGAGCDAREPPLVLDAGWTIHWVRGPVTARRLRLPTACGFGDPASLIDRGLVAEMLGPGWDIAPCGRGDISFMPSAEAARHGSWRRAAMRAGLTFIDPRDDPRAVLASVARCRLLLGGSFHGMVVADALRVPWVAVAPFASIQTADWQDWSGAMTIDFDFARLAPSSLAEQLRLTRLADAPIARAAIDRHERLLHRIAADRFADRAAEALCRAAASAACLTDDRALARARDCMHAALANMQRRSGAFSEASQDRCARV